MTITLNNHNIIIIINRGNNNMNSGAPAAATPGDPYKPAAVMVLSFAIKTGVCRR